jgi:hypothetical protein
VHPDAQVDAEATRFSARGSSTSFLREGSMAWAIGFDGLLYLGLFFPLLWILGAFMRSTERAAAA